MHGKTHIKRLIVSLIMLAAGIITDHAGAQQPNIFGAIGGIVNQAQMSQRRQAASDAWSKADPNLVNCISTHFGQNIQQLINSGVGPNDPSVSAQMAQCRQLIATAQMQQQAEAERQKQMAIDRANADRDRKIRETEAETARLKAKADAEKAAAEIKARTDAKEKQRQDEAVALRNDFILANLVGADPNDITVLIVAHDTPRVVRGLSGEPSFQSPAAACFPFGSLSVDLSTPTGRFVRNVAEKIAQKGGASIATAPCTPNDFGRFDLLIYTADQLSKADPEMLRPLSAAIKDGSYTKLSTYTQTAFEAEMQQRKAAVDAGDQRRNQELLAAKESFDKRESSDISAIYIEKPAVSVCVPTAQTEGLRYLLQRTDSPFADLVTKDTVLRDRATMDLTFLSIKKHECTTVVAPTGMIKEILPGLARDNITISFYPKSITADRLVHWKDVAENDQSGSKPWWRRMMGQ